MRLPRIYHSVPLQQQTDINLDQDAANHVGRVLRMQLGAHLLLFDGSNRVFNANVIAVDKKSVLVHVADSYEENRESPLHLHLGQVISRGERMEFTIQKSVELGVNTITPLLSERCGIKLDLSRMEKKISQWQKIAIAACEQSGRNQIPLIRPAMQLTRWCQEQDDCLKLNLNPHAQNSINTLPAKINRARLLIGSEGGLSQQELNKAAEHQFVDILLGPRVLRTETAALTIITALQVRFGDLG